METKRTQPIFPWYKERLQTKYGKAPASRLPSLSSGFLANVNLDDFSVSPSVRSVALRGIAPVILQSSRNPNYNSAQKPRKSINKDHLCFSKQMIQKQIRREYVSTMEEKLRQRPLSLFSHYKDHMTTELFNKVASVLDPDVCVHSRSSLPVPAADHAEEADEEKSTEPREENVNGEEPGAYDNQSIPDIQTPSTTNPIVLQLNAAFIKNGPKIRVSTASNHDMEVATKHFRQWFAPEGEEKCDSK